MWTTLNQLCLHGDSSKNSRHPHPVEAGGGASWVVSTLMCLEGRQAVILGRGGGAAGSVGDPSGFRTSWSEV